MFIPSYLEGAKKMGILNVVTGLQLIFRIAGGLWREVSCSKPQWDAGLGTSQCSSLAAILGDTGKRRAAVAHWGA